ncbi:hypothetical protein LQZ18_14355 [Lachnospiraceae bacterium ZAX-1]
MKKIMYMLILSALVLYILIFPSQAVGAASYGLVLWYRNLLPALLPFAILSHILIQSRLLDSFARLIQRVVKWIIPVSEVGIYPLFAGFLFGFPLGSKITSELVISNRMSREEGNKLFAICNNISPLFISSFMLHDSLDRGDLRLPTFLMLYGPPLIYYRITAHKAKNAIQKPQTGSHTINTKNTASRSQMNFKIIDAGIMNGFETLTKLGGYIMLFAILAQMTTCIPVWNIQIRCIMIGMVELTNGIAYTAKTSLPFEVKYPLIMLYTAFGGLSGIAQTASMVKGTGFRIWSYLGTKALCSIATLIFAIVYVQFFC